MNSTDNQKTWRRRARSTALKLNLGWWLEAFSPVLVLIGVTGFCAILFLRSKDLAPGGLTLTIGLGTAVVAGAGAALFTARRKFSSERDGMVRLESKMAMDNALTSADHGASDWPGPREETDDGIGWRWQWVAVPVLAFTGLIAGAFAVPFAEDDTFDAAKVNQPRAWEEMENTLKTLEEEEVVDPGALEEFEDRLAELRDQPKEEWYSHSSMEASDHQRSKLKNAVDELASNLAKSEMVLNALQNYSDQITDAAKGRLLTDFSDSLKGLELGDLPLNADLAEALKNIDPSKLRALSQAELDALRGRMKQLAAACKKCNGQGEGNGKGWGEMDDEELLSLINGNGQGGGSGFGQSPGRGGITRGPGTAPITLADDPSDLGTANIEGVNSTDLSRAAPSDLIQVTQGEHELDKAAPAPAAGGGITSPGQGGETVWKDALVPAEKAVLKRYFE